MIILNVIYIILRIKVSKYYGVKTVVSHLISTPLFVTHTQTH